MRILGIDPGIAITGWAIIEKKDKVKLIDYGCIYTLKGKKSSQRLKKIYFQLKKIIRQFKPQVVCLENLFFNTNVKTAFMVGEARGIIKLCAAQEKLKIEEFTPLEIKNSIVGYGRAEKNQIQQMVKILLHLKKAPQPDDAADAIAAALTYSCYNKKLK